MSTEFDKNISDCAMFALITKMALVFSWDVLNGQKIAVKKTPNIVEILGTKVVQFSCYTKLIKTKNVLLNWYYPTKFFLEKFGWFLTLKIDFENQILALWDEPNIELKISSFAKTQLHENINDTS